MAMKLSAERRAELLAEMRLAQFFTEKEWNRRFGVSPRTLRRLRAEALEHPLARSGDLHVLLLPPRPK
ncbi:MAG: hypothetical protein ACLQKH_09385 [Steroidobacteraceae bacterium]